MLAAIAYLQSRLFMRIVGCSCEVGRGRMLAIQAVLEDRLKSVWNWPRSYTCSPGCP